MSFVYTNRMDFFEVKSDKTMMSENWDIIAKYLANEELNDEELQIVENLKNDAEGQQLLRESVGVFDDTSLYLQQKQYNTLNAWQR